MKISKKLKKGPQYKNKCGRYNQIFQNKQINIIILHTKSIIIIQ